MRVPAAPWLSPSAEVRRSAIAGRGLFARESMKVGTIVARFGGELVSDEIMAAIIAASSTYVDTLSLDDDLNLVMPGRTPNGYGNHGCDPNLWWSDDLRLEARRSIAGGEELTLDYGTITDDATFRMPCRCGSAICRGEVTGSDWMLRDLRSSYGEHWVPGLRRKIASMG